MTTPPTPPLPTFVIIGAQKSATRWLRSNLGKHPDIFTPSHEPSFFNSRYRQGPDYYRAQFEGWSGEPIVGEATPGYMMWRHKPSRVARRIHETIPDARLIAVLRDPIDRANSAMWHHKRRGRLRTRSRLVDVVKKKKPTDDKMCIVTGGWYATSLEKYVELFGDQLLVILHDDIATDPLWVYRNALEHIGVDPDFVPPDLEQVVFSNQQPEKTKRDTTISLADRRKLWAYFSEEVDRLEPMIGRDLSRWDPTDDLQRWPAVPDDVTGFHRDALAWVETIVGAVDVSDFSRPTPCVEWNVAELIEHMAGLLVMNLALALQSGARSTAFDVARFGAIDDPRVHYHLAMEALVEAGADKRYQRTAVPTEAGMLPGDVQLMINLSNQVVHAWDLAVATVGDATIPTEIAAPLTTFFAGLLDRAPALGASYDEPWPTTGASTDAERLVALSGRDPALAARVAPT